MTEASLDLSKIEGGLVPFGVFGFALEGEGSDLPSAGTIVDGIPLDRNIVLLGESTHGTEEYYRTRAEVTKRLIEERKFKAVVFEADWPFMLNVNDYVHRRKQTPYPEGKEVFPSWMWRNQCMMEFFEWCKAKSPTDTPELFGMDCYSLFESKKHVIQFLEQHDPEFAKEVKGRLQYMDKFETGFEYGDAVVHGNLSRVSDYIQDCLTKIQSRLQWGSSKYECSEVERLSAEQNCEVLIAADEYYRKCVSEPAGSQASWNCRDQHMTTTLMRIQEHLKGVKIVVWAHNSHVGDSTATDRGGASFERNETWNLGQMVRATFGADKTWIIGQYTYTGSVVATQNWGGAHANRDLLPALSDSYEALMHHTYQKLMTILPNTKSTPSFFFDVVPFSDPKEKSVSLGSAGGTFHVAAQAVQTLIDAQNPVATSLVEMLQGQQRQQRWVGVSYHPDNEKRSHYGAMMLNQCYDEIVFVDVTKGLIPIQPKPAVKLAGPSTTGSATSSTMGSSKRLLKEYQKLLQNPPPGIEAHPLESNILEWHFALRLTDEPYVHGEYHGVLMFPAEYPMRAPAFRVLTPSGRFEPGVRLCMSMSDYHPESWNPSWSVETLLVGLQSFMYEESNAIGSLHSSKAERKKFAEASHAFNMKNQIFVEVFCSDSKATTTTASSASLEEAEKPQESVCRFCFSGEGQLIAPCMCKGSNEWVHLECLRQWQKSVLLTQPTHPAYQTSIDRICNICLEPFTGEGIPPSRHEQIMAYTGRDIANMVLPGNLLVTTRESSRENLELIARHPEIKERLMYWTKAVFLMVATGKEERAGLLAVSMSAPLTAPPRDAGVAGQVLWATRGKMQSVGKATYKLQHWNGGPMYRDTPICIAFCRRAKEIGTASDLLGGSGKKPLQYIPPHWIYGDFDAVKDQVTKDLYATTTTTTTAGADVKLPTIHVVWGSGGWGYTQLLAEIARGGWGIASVADYMAIHPGHDESSGGSMMELDWQLDFEWSRIMPLAKVAPKSEYQKYR